MKGKQYAYSYDGERYHGTFNTVEQAIAEAGNDRTVWIGEVKQMTYADFTPNAYHIIERMQEAAYEDGPECAEIYLDSVTKEQREAIDKELPDVLYALFKKHGVDLCVNFFSVENSYEVKS